MKLLNKFFYYFSIITFIISLVAFVRIFFDSMDLDRAFDIGLYRSSVLNRIIPFFIFPGIIILCTLWIQKLKNNFKINNNENRYPKSIVYIMPVFWWIPFVHFLGSFNTFKVLINYTENTLSKADLIKIKSGTKWVNFGFIIFYSLVIIGLVFNFINHNKDSYDFLLNVLFLHLLVISFGFMKIASGFASAFDKMDE